MVEEKRKQGKACRKMIGNNSWLMISNPR